ncbi:hypothetical protein ES708_25719 [subsurface metagenome]
MLIKLKSWLRKRIAFYKLNKSIKKMSRFPKAIKKTVKEILRLQRAIQRKEFDI